MSIFNSPTSAQNTPPHFAEEWKKVSEAESKGLPASALLIVNRIYGNAKAAKNEAQVIKALIHQLKYANEREDNTLASNIVRTEQELKEATPIAKLFLHSMLGEMYWKYYQNNRWKFADRTQTTQFDNADLATWSLEQIVQKATRHYLQSCENITLAASPLNQVKMEDILNKGNSRGEKLQPSLYDFLAHRALDFFKNEEPNIIKPAYVFTLNKEAYLTNADEFVLLKIENKDSLSTKFHALTLLQSLIQFHLKDSDPSALVQVDLERLEFVYRNATFSDKSSLYTKALEQLEGKVIKHPSSTLVTLAIAQEYVSQGSAYKALQGDAHKWDLKKAFEICETAKKRFPESDGALKATNLQFTLQAKTIQAQTEDVLLPNQPFKALVHYKNIKDLHWRIIKTSREEVKAQRKKYARNYEVDREEKFLDFFAAKTPLKSGHTILPTDGDYQTHSVEIKLEGLPFGEYMVLLSHHTDFNRKENGLAYSFTSVSQLSHIHRNNPDGSTDVYVLDRESGEGVADVTSEIFYQTYNYQTGENEIKKGETYTSNAKGYIKVPYLSTKDSYRESFSFLFTKGDDRLNTEKIEGGYGTFNQYPENKGTYFHQTIFFLDRAIYRPGQTIYFKGLAIENLEKTTNIIPHTTVTVTLLDVNYQEVATQSLNTNEYGTFNGTFTAPSSGLMGNMHIKTSSGNGEAHFSVEEYKRPKFEVKFDTLKGTFRLGDLIQSKGLAQAYSGANIDGAKVAYRVVRQAEFPFWWWCRWGYYPTSPEMEITNGITQTDENGHFSVPFQAIPDGTVDKSSDPRFNYTVYADVTDINGETHSAQTVVTVGYKALVLTIGASDLDLAAEEAAQVSLATTNLAGMDEPSTGQINVYLLKSPSQAYRKRLWERPDKQLFSKEEHNTLFPLDVYEEEGNDLKWPKDKTVLQHTFDTGKDKKIALEQLKKWPLGRYQIEASTTDKFGQEVKEVAYFNLFDTKDKKLEVPTFEYFQALKTKAEPNEVAMVVIGSSSKTNLLYEIEKDGKLFDQQWLPLKDEKHLFEIPIKEEYRGNIALHYAFVKHNRLYTHTQSITVPYTNKSLAITFETFRDKLQPGQQEEWRMKIKGNTADKIAAEMVATMYDASLDVFRPNSWNASFWPWSQPRLAWNSQNGFVSSRATVYDNMWNDYSTMYVESPYFAQLNWFGYFFGHNYYRMGHDKGAVKSMARNKMARQEDQMEEKEALMEMSAPAPAAAPMGDQDNLKGGVTADKKSIVENKKETTSGVQPRTNFNETAFFYPTLSTNNEGELVIKFTLPDALTRWKMLGFAHTKDLKYGFVEKELVTQKDLMVVPNQPRFFREGDMMTFSAKLTNLSSQALTAQAKLTFQDALSGKDVSAQVLKQNESKTTPLKAKQSGVVEWDIQIPDGLQALTYRIVAQAGSFSDGEEMTLPVVTNRMLVTESLPLPIRGKQTKTFTFDKLVNNKSTTLKSHKYTLEFTSNPAWYAVQALPYLIEYPYECVEQTFSRYYANSLASHIANSNPKIKQVFDTWRNIQPDALLSNLEKNQTLKSALLEETPWVLQAKDESQRKRDIALLFDLNRMANEQDKALEKLKKAQTPSGGFTWFPKMPEDRYMTQHIVAGFGHLQVMGITSKATEDLALSTLNYLDKEMEDDYARLKASAKRKEIKLEEYKPGYLIIHYLYARSYFKEKQVSKQYQEAFRYFLAQTKKYWRQDNLYLEGLIALGLHRFGDTETPTAIIKSLKERALHSEELGMYYKQTTGYYWYQAPIETQALLIEVFDEVAKDQKSVEDLKVWLLKQKQTQDWKTTKATAEACYALLRRGTDALANTNVPLITVGGKTLDLTKQEGSQIEAGTGYFKTSWTADQINPSMGEINITKSDEGVAWGAAYWQYFEQLDKITTAETPLKLKKQLFVQQNTDRGPVISPIATTPLKIGDLVKVRIELRTDRNMEYIHLKDLRAAGFEPVSTLSEAKYQDGLSYYESPRDLATHFFIGYLPKGTYVFEYALRVSQKGNFSNGVTTIQCMYAPEFSSHSEGIRVRVE